MFTTQLIYKNMQKKMSILLIRLSNPPHSASEMKPKILNVRTTKVESQRAVALVAYCPAGLIRKLIMIVTVGKQEDDTPPSQSCNLCNVVKLSKTGSCLNRKMYMYDVCMYDNVRLKTNVK
jgi:hypothetical protein